MATSLVWGLPAMRKLLVPLLLLTALLFNPIVLSFILTRVAEAAGPAVSAFIDRNESWILIGSTVYFLIVVTSLAGRLIGWRRQRATRPRVVPEGPYRGPGGGKRPPRPRVRRGRGARR